MPRHNSKPIDLWDALANDLILSKERRPEGKGWLQMDEIAKRQKISLKSAQQLVAQAAGKVERFEGVVWNNGFLRTRVWYRPKA